MSQHERALIASLHGFRKFEDGYPCHWCGIVTTYRDAEDFHVCWEHQEEEVRIGYEEMKRKYTLAGMDERNPEFFAAKGVS